MKIRDIMAANGGNLSWCKPMMDESENAIVMMEGKAINAVFDGVEFGGYNREKLDKAISAYAKSVEDYEWRHDMGMSDLDIALGSMREGDCANCPFNSICDAMDEDADDDKKEEIHQIAEEYENWEELRSWAQEYFDADFGEHDIDDVRERLMDEVKDRVREIGCDISDIDESDMEDIQYGIRYVLRNLIDLDRENYERRVCFYDVDAFGPDCPGNWGELACYMEDLAEEMGYDVENNPEDAEAFWNYFWNEYHSPNHGKLVNVPELTERDPLDDD